MRRLPVAIVSAAFLCAPSTRAAAPLSLTEGRISLQVSADTGTVLSLADVASGITLAAPPELAESFRLALQIPDQPPATIIGKDQPLALHASEAGSVKLEWGPRLRDTAGAEHDLTVRMAITAADGRLAFTLHVDNRSAGKLTEARYPMLGGLTGLKAPGKACDASLWVPTSTPTEKSVTLPFGEVEYGYPGQMNMAFTCIRGGSADRSLYFASEDPIARYKVYRFSEIGSDVFASVVHVPQTPPGGVFDGSPVAARFVDGDWRGAGKVYREWFIRAFGLADPRRDWIRRESFFVFTMFMLPEGTINMRFRDIPKWARAAKEHGIHAVQISGWQQGGHDNGYPDYTPDRRLGTWDELAAGIRYCHQLGLKVYFFANYQPMMVESDWYQNDLKRYREMTPDGGYTWMAGWGMGTLWARMGHPKLMTWADLGFPEYRKIIVDQFARLAAIGADGVHVDKMFPTAVDYNPDIPLPPDISTWEGAILLSREIMAACRARNPDWAMSFECNWDRMLEFGRATWWVGNQLITRQVFPENAETTSITMAYDTLGINNLVRDGHIVMVTPQSFSRGLDWPPAAGLADYIKEIKRLRDGLADTVFYGQPLGATGLRPDQHMPDGVQYSVFGNRTTGRHVCALTNARMEDRTLTFRGFEGSSSWLVRIVTPFERPSQLVLPAEVRVPAERIVFVEELPTKGPGPIAASSAPKRMAPPAQSSQSPANGGFETGDFTGWEADSNWVVVDNSCGYYSGWAGKWWAWSGGKGEPATGVLRSKPFVLDQGGVALRVSGWASVRGTGQPRRWNYVTLNAEDGRELDRVYAPDTTAFVPAWLDGSGHRGERVTIVAVDDADQPTFSMLCIDDVHTADPPGDFAQSVAPLPAFDPIRSIRLEDERVLIEASRANGSITRIRDKQGGLELIREPRLAGSFRFSLVIPGKEPWQTIEANWVYGRDQRLTSASIDGNRLTLHWEGPLRNYLGEEFGVSATMTVRLTGDGARFDLAISNHTALPVGETYFPVLGGIQGLGTTRGQLKATRMVRPMPDGGTASDEIFRIFANQSPFGDQGPEQFYACPAPQPEPWLAFVAPKANRSALIGAVDAAKRDLVFRLELVPSSSGTPRDDGNWPRPEELNGQPVGVEMSLVDTSMGRAGDDHEAAPAFLQFCEGSDTGLRPAYESWHD